VILDASAMGFERVSVSGGAFGVNLHVAPDCLVRHLSAAIVDVSTAEPRVVD
jgi:prolyl-tRNA editing enzyme YbaK/EbsC (Cys-tRNA(Pro) deacylase)